MPVRNSVDVNVAEKERAEALPVREPPRMVDPPENRTVNLPV